MMMKRLWVTSAAISALLLTGCSGGGASSADAVTVEISAATMAFGQKEVTVQKGQPVKLVLNNQDGQLHDFAIDKIPASVTAEHSANHQHGGGTTPDLHVAADAGKTATVAFTPTKEGTYTFYCTVPGHKQAGMVGTLVVKG